MKLADLRKLAVRRQFRIRFRISNGLECIVNQHGVAQVPALHGIPDFNLEKELESVSQFGLEPAVADPKKPSPARFLTRDELATMADSSPVAAPAEHEEE
jgi:hypothetical protein